MLRTLTTFTGRILFMTSDKWKISGRSKIAVLAILCPQMPISDSPMMGRELVSETSGSLYHLTLLMAQKDFINSVRRESFRWLVP
jgi:hypothetical protein